MDLSTPIPWTKGQLKRLGKAMVSGVQPPANGPSYEEVLAYHDDLTAQVAAEIMCNDWVNLFEGEINLSARPKTRDTLIEKLKRTPPHLTLHEVQDIAGVRIDSAQLCLTHQRLAAREIAHYFGYESTVQDLLDNPHSGYRAVHVWVRVPAGRAEVQIRTLAQSAWANTYEGFADLVGRGIRYGEQHNVPEVQQVVDALHRTSEDIRVCEETLDYLEHQYGCPDDSLDNLPEEERHAVVAARQEAHEQEVAFVSMLEKVAAMIKGMERSQ
ncbi:GTP pyrophosphokinase [Gordonia sputi]